jgi:hypothetical protein
MGYDTNGYGETNERFFERQRKKKHWSSGVLPWIDILQTEYTYIIHLFTPKDTGAVYIVLLKRFPPKRFTVPSFPHAYSRA